MNLSHFLRGQQEYFDSLHRRHLPKPLQPAGTLATLLVVEGLLSIEDAANAVRVTPADLVREAEGWAAGAALNNPPPEGE